MAQICAKSQHWQSKFGLAFPHFQVDFRYSVLQLAPLHAPLSESLASLWFGLTSRPNGRIVSSLKLKKETILPGQKGRNHEKSMAMAGQITGGMALNPISPWLWRIFCFTSNDSLWTVLRHFRPVRYCPVWERRRHHLSKLGENQPQDTGSLKTCTPQRTIVCESLGGLLLFETIVDWFFFETIRIPQPTSKEPGLFQKRTSPPSSVPDGNVGQHVTTTPRESTIQRMPGI